MLRNSLRHTSSQSENTRHRQYTAAANTANNYHMVNYNQPDQSLAMCHCSLVTY